MIDFGAITTRPCENVVPPLDPRCSDPAFSIANPGVCPPTPTLIIKPGVALCCALGSIQFKAFTVFGTIETDVTDQAVFSSSDMDIAVIGAASGNATATGIQAGQVTISASFNGMQAHADLTVLAGDNCCTGTEVALTVLVDNSLSMSQGFNSAYATKLAYAKAAALRFIGEINGLKDLVGLDSFNSDTALTLAAPTHNQGSVGALVSTINQTQSDTAFFNGLQQAINDLNGSGANLKVLLLISDGLATATEPDSPFTLLSDFKSQGGIVMCLGVRAGAIGFAVLSSFATPGFFVNGYDATAADAINFISGLKGYICAGNCTPAGDVMTNKGALDYRGFLNWDVVNGASTVIGGSAAFPLAGAYFTFTTTVPHGFTSGDQITIAGDVLFALFNGTYTITVTSPTEFTCPATNHFPFSSSGLAARKDPTPGSVDLLGNGFFDFLPGNGLYVDLISGIGESPPFNGQLVSKKSFHLGSAATFIGRVANNGTDAVATFTSNAPHGLAAGQDIIISGAAHAGFNGHFTVRTVYTAYVFDYIIAAPIGVVLDVPVFGSIQPQYKLTVSLAGNQLASRPADTVAVQVYWLNAFDKVFLLNQQVNISDYKQGFTDFAFNFTITEPVIVYIAIQQLDVPSIAPTAGVLLGEVKLEEMTSLVTILDDNFDAENPQYVPPRCGFGTTYLSYGYAYGYNCYGVGCLDTPPPAQRPDPNQLPDIESGPSGPGITYTSTQTVQTTCAGGSVSLANLVGCAIYGPPQAADCPTVAAVETEFGTGLFNFQYTLLSAQAPVAYQLTRKPGSGTGPPSAWTFDGSNDGVTWTTLDTESGQTFASGETKEYYSATTTPYLFYRLHATTGAPSETLFQIYLTAPEQASGTGTATSTISQADADAKARAAALADAQAKLNCQIVFTSTQSYTATCGPGISGSPGEATATATATSVTSQADADAKATAAAKLAAEAMLVCEGSNNLDPLIINDRGPDDPGPKASSPYPGVEFISGMTGLITKVTIHIESFNHSWPSDVCMVLKAPDGTTCVLMANVSQGGVAANLNLDFDDTGVAMPQIAPLAAVLYKPTTYPAFADVPAPGPVSPYGAALSVFNGKDPNGAWTLWICDEQPNNDGFIQRWNLTITT